MRIIRIMFKRIVQPPIDTSAMEECKSEEFEISDDLYGFLSGRDANGCAISSNVLGMEMVALSLKKRNKN